MNEKYERQTEKSPLGAAILSCICPGVGFFYIGDALKAIAYMIIFACLIVLQVKVRGGDEHAIVGIMQLGFYLFQIFDAYDAARKLNKRIVNLEENEVQSSLFSGVMLALIGVIFQLAQLKVIRFNDIINLWPVMLIVIGAYYIFSFYKENKKEIKQ